MQKSSFKHRLTTIIIALAWALPISAKSSNERNVESATNKDGSALRITTNTNWKTETRHVTVYHRPQFGEKMQPIWSRSFSMATSYAAGVTQINDWNEDGVIDVSVTLDCGAGMACETIQHNINNKTRQMVPIGTTYGITKIISGYLVDMVRGNCCSWIGTAHRLSEDRQRFDPVEEFSVFVAADAESATTLEKPAKCYFYKKTKAGEEVIPAPTPALKRLCRWYD